MIPLLLELKSNSVSDLCSLLDVTSKSCVKPHLLQTADLVITRGVCVCVMKSLEGRQVTQLNLKSLFNLHMI